MSDLLNSASLVMIPSGYAEDKVYSVVPSDGSGDLSFTRASNGTRINSAGLVEVCPWNLVQYSEEFDNAYWSKFNDSVTANVTTAPNGTTTADKEIPNTTNDIHGVIRNLGAFAGNIYTASIYLKNAGYNFGFLRLSTNSDVDRYAIVVNLTTGVVTSTNSGGSPTNVTYSVDNIGGGWFRVSLSMGHSSGDVYEMSGACPSGTPTFAANIPSFAGNGTDGAFIWGAQLNIGSTAKPYFPTTDRLNVPRLTYQNGGGGCPSLLLEKQSTNIATYSEQFDNADWTKIQSSITANSVTSPDGTTNADTFTADGTNNEHQLRSSGLISLVNGTTYTTSIFVKANTNNFVQFVGSGSPYASTTYANFNIATGVVGDVGAGTTAKIENFGNGWYRCSMTATAIATTTTNTFLLNIVTSNTAVRGETNTLSTSVYIYGAQLEASSYPTSYIPTTSSSATRVADACFKTGISSLIGQTEGVIFIDYNTFGFNNFDRFIALTDGSNNRIGLLRNTTNDQLYFFVELSGSLIINAAGISGTNVLGRHKIAAGYKSGDYVVYMDGVQVYTSAASGVPATSQLFVGTSEDGLAQNTMSGIISEAVVFKTRLSNSELIALTTI